MKTSICHWIQSCCLVSALLLSGCKNNNGTLIPIEYLPVQISEGDNWSIIDKNGQVIIKEEYSSDCFLTKVSDGMFWVRTNGKYQLFSIDSPKKAITDEEFSSVTNFNSGVAAVSNPNQAIRIINTNGETVATLPKSVKRCYEFSRSGYAYFMNSDNKMGIIDVNGNVRLSADYSELSGDLREGIILARKGGDDKKFLILGINGNAIGDIDTEKYFDLYG